MVDDSVHASGDPGWRLVVAAAPRRDRTLPPQREKRHMANDVGWLPEFLDGIDHAAGIVDADGTFQYANRAARKSLSARGRAGRPAPCPELRELVGQVLADQRERRGAVVEVMATRSRWRLRVWPFGDGRAAFWGERLLPMGTAAARLAARLGLELPEARLGLWVAQGVPNHVIAVKLGLPPGTLNRRLSRLYRKVGVRSRTELAARIVEQIMTRDADDGT